MSRAIELKKIQAERPSESPSEPKQRHCAHANKILSALVSREWCCDCHIWLTPAP